MGEGKDPTQVASDGELEARTLGRNDGVRSRGHGSESDARDKPGGWDDRSGRKGRGDDSSNHGVERQRTVNAGIGHHRSATAGLIGFTKIYAC